MNIGLQGNGTISIRRPEGHDYLTRSRNKEKNIIPLLAQSLQKRVLLRKDRLLPKSLGSLVSTITFTLRDTLFFFFFFFNALSISKQRNEEAMNTKREKKRRIIARVDRVIHQSRERRTVEWAAIFGNRRLHDSMSRYSDPRYVSGLAAAGVEERVFRIKSCTARVQTGYGGGGGGGVVVKKGRKFTPEKRCRTVKRRNERARDVRGVSPEREEWCVDVATVESMFFGKYCLVSETQMQVGNSGIKFITQSGFSFN